jgi:hypothetical protein
MAQAELDGDTETEGPETSKYNMYTRRAPEEQSGALWETGRFKESSFWFCTTEDTAIRKSSTVIRITLTLIPITLLVILITETLIPEAVTASRDSHYSNGDSHYWNADSHA